MTISPGMARRLWRAAALGVVLALGAPAALAQAAAGQAPAPQTKRAKPSSIAQPLSPAFEKTAKQAATAREAGRLEEAIQLYQKALALWPSWPEGLWSVGTIYYDLDRYQEAGGAFRRLVALQGKNGPALAFKGLCEFQLGNYERALDDLQRAGELGLGNVGDLAMVSRYHLAILLTREGQFEVAFNTLSHFAKESNASPKVIEAFGLATLRMPLLPAETPPDKREMVLIAGRASFYQAQRQHVAARKGFEQLALRFPEAPNVHYAFGVLLLAEEPDTAIEKFQRELQVSPYHLPARLQIAFERIKRGEFEKALPPAREAVEIAPDDFPARKAYGEALLGVGQVPEAVEQLENGVKLAPDSPGMRFALARSYARAGRADDAARERAEFLRLDKIYRTMRTGAQSVGGIAERVERIPDKP